MRAWASSSATVVSRSWHSAESSSASLRDVGEGLFGADAVADWYSDGGLRSKVRRLVRRGDALMRGGYRRLAQLPPLEKGRFEDDAKRP